MDIAPTSHNETAIQSIKMDRLVVDEADSITAQESPNIGDRYEILSEIGQGGMGTVFKAHDKVLGQDFAIKLLHANLAADNAQARRFEQEAKTARELTHPNLVAVYDNGISSDGAPFIVMDYIDGKTLAQVVQEEIFIPPMRAIDLFIQICQAVSHAHMKGVIHRDLKPSNILITVENQVERAHVTDFGIAKLFNENSEATQLTQTGDVFGSPIYMSPEQGTGEPLDHRSDIYSLGCVMYETLSSKPPFAGTNPVKLIMKHVKEPVPPFAKHLAIPVALEAVVMRCLEKDKALRYQSIEELENDLKRLQAGEKDLAHLKVASKKSTANSQSSFGRVKIHPSVDSLYLLNVAAIVLLAILLLCILNASMPTGANAIALTLTGAVCLLFCVGYCWIIKNEILLASRLLNSEPTNRISAKLQRWPFGLILEAPDLKHTPRQRKFIVNFQREYRKLLYATADNTIKDFRVVLDPQTQCPVALLIGDFTCTLLAINQLRSVKKLIEPLAVFIRRTAAAIIDTTIIAAPVLVLYPVAPFISDALGLRIDGIVATSLCTAIFMISLVDGVLPCFIPMFIYSMCSCAFDASNPIGVNTSTMLQNSPVARFWIVVCALMIIWNLIYHSGFEASAWRATPGKALFQLFASNKNGNRLSIGHSLLRHCARLGFSWLYLVCWIAGLYVTTGLLGSLNPYVILVLIPSVLVLLTQRQQAPHDLVTSTLLNSRPGPTWKATSFAGIFIVGCVLATIYFLGFIKNDLGKCYLTACGIVPVQIHDVHLQTNPNDLKELEQRADSFFNSKRFDKAHSDYEQLAKLDAKNSKALDKLSQALTELGEYKRARDSLDRLIAIDTKEPSHYYARGLLDLYLGEPKAAVSDFERSRNKQLAGSAQNIQSAIMESFAYRVLDNTKEANLVISNETEAVNAMVAKTPSARTPQHHMLKYLHREISKDQLISADFFSDEFRCVIAIDLALSGKRAEAISALKEVRRSSSRDAFGYKFAMVLLAQLES